MGKLSCKISQFCNVGNDVVMNVKFFGYGLFPYINGSMKCVSYTRTLPWKNHQSELTIAEQNQRIAAYLAEHKELDLLKKYSDRKNDEKARTAFDQMTDDGVERKFDCIIVASMVSAFIENVFVHDGGRIVVRFKYEQSIQDTVKALQTG